MELLNDFFVSSFSSIKFSTEAQNEGHFHLPLATETVGTFQTCLFLQSQRGKLKEARNALCCSLHVGSGMHRLCRT